MPSEILSSILRRIGRPDLVEILSEQLRPSEFNTLMLEVAHRRAAAQTPAELLRAYTENRFVQPATVDPIAFAEYQLAWQRAAQDAGFAPKTLSPLAPLGACSAVGTVHQDKVMSAQRGTEVVADATNVLALESARQRRRAGFPIDLLRLSATHRHVRTPPVHRPGYSAHFSILALTTAGRDTGDFRFETAATLEHIDFYVNALPQLAGRPVSAVRLRRFPGAHRLFAAVLAQLQAERPEWLLELVDAQPDEAYYRGLQFKIVIELPGAGSVEIADGGLVDWTQTLSGNRKERFFISGIGIELLKKFEDLKI